MHPECFELFPGRPIYWYGVMVAFAFLLAIAHWSILGRREGVGSGFGTDLGVWILAFGIIGARIAYVASHPDLFREEPLSIVRIDQGGLIFFGGFLGGCVGAVFFARVRGLALWPLGDLVITALPLGHVPGRIGCFLNGCCYGRAYDGFLAVKFPFLKHTVHPVQLYEAGLNALLYLGLLFLYARRRKDGTVVAVYLIGYGLIRFVMEFFRGDQRHYLGALSWNQLFCILLVAIGAGLLQRLPARRTALGTP